MSTDTTITSRFSVNGSPVAVTTATSRVLADVLREDLGLRGTKISCDQGACGACTVLVNGRPTAACSTFVFELDGRKVVTVEAASDRAARLGELRAAFARNGAVQCGFCTAGMLMFASWLATAFEEPSRETIREALSGNWCRCTGYETIVDAIYSATRPGAARPEPTA